MIRDFMRQLFGRKRGPERNIFEVTGDFPCLPLGDLPCEDLDMLNPLQSCFKTHYNPEKNCVVVSGTGSGKTIIAYIGGGCYLNEGKRLVLTAPTRELVRELYDDACGIFGRQVVGLYNGTDKSVEGKFVIVTTPEGYLSGLRGNREWATSASLLIVDEAHNLIHPSRGCSLDAAVTMFRRMGGRLLLMSGTFPNAGDVSLHLDADLFLSRYERTKLIRKEIHAPDDLEAIPRPKKLTEGMVLTGSGYTYNRNSLRLQKLRELLVEKNGASVIVFVPTKAQGYCLSHALNVPFHCKDVPEDDKKAMAADFRAGRIKTIAATDTLSQGINTPADISVVCGGRRGGYYLDSSDVRQREGRAGRGKDAAESFLIGDKIELFHMKKEVYTKTLPLPTEEMVLTLLCMKNITREEICSALLSTFAATLMSRQKVVEAVNRYINFLNACHILREKNGEYRLTEEGALLARYFIPPSAYMGYIKLARKLTGSEMNDVERGCILLSTLIQSLPSQGCPPRYEKDFQMKLIKMEMDKELSAARAGILKHYLEKPSAIPAFLGGCIKEIERWFGMLSDMEKYKIHEESPGKQWMDGLVETLKINILKMLARKKSPPSTERLPFEGNGS